ncbi:hypothetical protein PCE1_002434 [Barthelona sp. PCE]
MQTLDSLYVIEFGEQKRIVLAGISQINKITYIHVEFYNISDVEEYLELLSHGISVSEIYLLKKSSIKTEVIATLFPDANTNTLDTKKFNRKNGMQVMQHLRWKTTKISLKTVSDHLYGSNDIRSLALSLVLQHAVANQALLAQGSTQLISGVIPRKYSLVPNAVSNQMLDDAFALRLFKPITALGRKKLAEWISTPLCHIPDIIVRQNLCKSFHTAHVRGNSDQIKRTLKRIKPSMTRIQSDNSIKVFKDIISTCEALLALSNMTGCQELGNSVFSQMLTQLSSIIDITENTIRSGINTELDLLRESHSNLPPFLTRLTQLELIWLPRDVGMVSYNYFPRVGYVLNTPNVPSLLTNIQDKYIETHFSIPGFQPIMLADVVSLVVETEKAYVWKTPIARHVDSVIGDVYSDILTLESEILNQLQRETQQYISHFEEAFDLVATIDLSLSVDSWVYPSFNSERVIHVEGMVNPRYYDRVTCVPQDFHGCITSVLLTAANNAGKSFFLNSLLDTVFLAHCGLPVTAEHVDLPPFDAIAAHSGLNGPAEILSSFERDCLIVNCYDSVLSSDSFLVLDEFGKGTTMVDALAVMATMMNKFSEKRLTLIASSHMQELSAWDLLSPKVVNYRITDSDDGEKYRLEQGVADSKAIRLARQLQLNIDIITRVEEVYDLLKRGKAHQIYPKFLKPSVIEKIERVKQALYNFSPVRKDALGSVFKPVLE